MQSGVVSLPVGSCRAARSRRSAWAGRPGATATRAMRPLSSTDPPAVSHRLAPGRASVKTFTVLPRTQPTYAVSFALERNDKKEA